MQDSQSHLYRALSRGGSKDAASVQRELMADTHMVLSAFRKNALLEREFSSGEKQNKNHKTQAPFRPNQSFFPCS